MTIGKRVADGTNHERETEMQLETKINDYARLGRVNGAVYCLETTNDDDETRESYIVRVDPPDGTEGKGLWTLLMWGFMAEQGFESVDHAVEWALEKLHLDDV